VDAHRGKYDENAVATGDGALDDLAVVGRPRYDRDALLEGIELFHAGVAAHADDLVAAIQGVLHHVLPELSGSPYDADLPHLRKFTLGRRAAAPLRIKRYSSMCVSGSDAGDCDRTVIRPAQNLDEYRGLRTHTE
jgi:hypothetical protein